MTLEDLQKLKDQYTANSDNENALRIEKFIQEKERKAEE